MTLERFQGTISTFIFVALLLAALILALDAFQDDLGTNLACTSSLDAFNQTSRSCVNASDSGDPSFGSTTTAFNVTQEGLEGGKNASTFLSTIGTLIGVAALIGVVVGAFFFAQK